MKFTTSQKQEAETKTKDLLMSNHFIDYNKKLVYETYLKAVWHFDRIGKVELKTEKLSEEIQSGNRRKKSASKYWSNKRRRTTPKT